MTANGPAGGDLRVDAKFGGAGLDASARGTLHFSETRGAFDVTFAAADARLPRRDPGAVMPVTLATRLSVDGERLSLEALDGKIAGTAVKGRIGLVLGGAVRPGSMAISMPTRSTPRP